MSRGAVEGVTVRDLVNRFLTSQRLLVDCGEITAHAGEDAGMSCQRPETQMPEPQMIFGPERDWWRTALPKTLTRA